MSGRRREFVGRRDFIHRMSSTLGVVAATYRSVGLLAPLPHGDAALGAPTVAPMSWFGEALPASYSEMFYLRRFAIDLLQRDQGDAAYDLLVHATSVTNVSAAEYLLCLDALESLCELTARPRVITTLDWYLGREAAIPAHASDGARARDAMGDPLGAALLYLRAGFVAHAARTCELAGDKTRARTLYASLVRKGHDDVSRALALHGVARCAATDDAARARAFSSVDSMLARSGVHASDRFDGITGARYVVPLLDSDHRHDPAEIVAPLLLQPQRLEGFVSSSATTLLRRRALTVRLLALELERRDSEELRELLARRIGQLGTPRFLPQLEAWAQGSSPRLRYAADDAMREIGRSRRELPAVQPTRRTDATRLDRFPTPRA